MPSPLPTVEKLSQNNWDTGAAVFLNGIFITGDTGMKIIPSIYEPFKSLLHSQTSRANIFDIANMTSNTPHATLATVVFMGHTVCWRTAAEGRNSKCSLHTERGSDRIQRSEPVSI